MLINITPYFSEESVIQLNKLSDSLHPLTGPPLTRPTPSTLYKLIETLELVIVSVLGTHKDSFISECSSQDGSVFGTVESLLTGTVTCLDEFLKVSVLSYLCVTINKYPCNLISHLFDCVLISIHLNPIHLPYKRKGGHVNSNSFVSLVMHLLTF